MAEPVKRAINGTMVDDIYIALKDAESRLSTGTMLLVKCINYLEKEHNYKPCVANQFVDVTTMGGGYELTLPDSKYNP